MAKKKTESVLAIQHGGNHYKGMGIQPVEYALANDLDCLQYSVVKYCSRHKLKGSGIEDMKKCIHFAQMILEKQYGITSSATFADEVQATATAPPARKRPKPPTAHLTANRRKQKN